MRLVRTIGNELERARRLRGHRLNVLTALPHLRHNDIALQDPRVRRISAGFIYGLGLYHAVAPGQRHLQNAIHRRRIEGQLHAVRCHGGNGCIGCRNQLGLLHSSDLLDLIVVVEVDTEITRRVFQIAVGALIGTVSLFCIHFLDLPMIEHDYGRPGVQRQGIARQPGPRREHNLSLFFAVAHLAAFDLHGDRIRIGTAPDH